MWEKIKKIYNRIWLVGMGLFLMFFFLYLLFTIFYRGVRGDLDSISMISIVAIGLSFPGIVNTIADEYNPRKKTYKLSCQCPKCKHLIRMDMKEE